MTTKQRAVRAGIAFIALLILGGIALMYKGNDALALATEKKEGILTAEQVRMSFDSVSGRLAEEAVKEGDVVKKGDVIMLVGSTGQSTGPHLHYEVWVNGEKTNPLNYYNTEGLSYRLD